MNSDRLGPLHPPNDSGSEIESQEAPKFYGNDTSDLLKAFECGRLRLVEELSTKNAARTKKSFIGKNPSTEHAINTAQSLCGMSDQLIDIIIKGQLHDIFSTSRSASLRLPAQHVIHLQSTPGQELEKPVIYGAVIVDRNGNPPNRLEWMVAVEYALDYTDDSHTSNVPWSYRDAYAKTIDNCCPAVADRNWSSGKALREAKRAKDSHFRRYMRSNFYNKGCRNFLEHLKAKLLAIDDADAKKPVPFSPAYIGWTRQESRRFKEHIRHRTQTSSIIYLLDAIFHLVYSKYKLHITPLLNVQSAQEAVVMEHIISLLAQSYTESGGLNVATGGDEGLLTIAHTNAKEDTWHNGLRALVEQDVYDDNMDVIKKRSEMEALAEACETTQSSIDLKEEAVEEKHSRYGQNLVTTILDVGSLREVVNRTEATRKVGLNLRAVGHRLEALRLSCSGEKGSEDAKSP